MKIETAIKKTKEKLIAQAKKKGLWENFGQKELSNLEDKFDYFNLCFGTPEDHRQARLISDFGRWCMNYTGE